jgi:hypothetical protein
MKRALLTFAWIVAFSCSLPPAFADSCNASKSCTDGMTKSCSGASSCLVLTNGVRCDNQSQFCATTCSANLTCPWINGRQYQLTCSGYSSCAVGDDQYSVICDGVTKTCDDCEAAFQDHHSPQCAY